MKNREREHVCIAIGSQMIPRNSTVPFIFFRNMEVNISKLKKEPKVLKVVASGEWESEAGKVGPESLKGTRGGERLRKIMKPMNHLARL